MSGVSHRVWTMLALLIMASAAVASASSGVDDGVTVSSLIALHRAVHHADAHPHVRRHHWPQSTPDAHRAHVFAAQGNAHTNEEGPSNLHALQLQSGALHLTPAMLQAAHTSHTPTLGSGGGSDGTAAWGELHRRTMRTMNIGAAGAARESQQPREVPRPPHRVFSHDFFHADTQQKSRRSARTMAARSTVEHHQPHLLHRVRQEAQPLSRGRGDEHPADADLSLHIPNAHTLDLMRSYFTASGNDTAASLAALYGADTPDEALNTHPSFFYQWLLHLKAPVTPQVRQAVEAIIAPYTLQHYLPHASFLVSLPYEVALRVQQGIARGGSTTDPSGAEPSTGARTAVSASAPVLFIAMYHAAFKVQSDLSYQLAAKMLFKTERDQRGFAHSSVNSARPVFPAPPTEDEARMSSRQHSHELRLTFTHPSFSPQAASASAGAGGAAPSRLFPRRDSDTRLLRDYASKQEKHWNNHAKFLEAMAAATSQQNNATRARTRAQSQSQRGNKGIEFRVVDSSQVVVRLPSELGLDTVARGGDSDANEPFLAHFLSSLSQQHGVQHIEAHSVFRPLNKHARYVVQSDLETEARCADSPATGRMFGEPISSGAGSLPLSRGNAASQYRVARSSTAELEAPFSGLMGLDGRGALLTIGDTGTDFDSCYFHDEAHSVVVNGAGPDPLHRKIAGYITAPAGDTRASPRAGPGDQEGHGTHTAGSLAGSISPQAFPLSHAVDNYTYSALEQYNGMAPGARLLVFDFQNPGDSALYVPNDIKADYLAISHAWGSRVSSNSWGDESGVYDSYTRDVDDFLWRHDDFLMLMAAGNEGLKGAHSLATPAVAKNLLTVGASMNGVCSFFEQGHASGLNIVAPDSLAGQYAATPASFGPSYIASRPRPLPGQTHVQACYANPPNGCSALLNAQECAGKVVMVERGVCTFSIKAANVQRAGGAVFALLNNDASPSFIMDGDAATAATLPISIPSIALAKTLSDRLRPVLVRPAGAADGAQSLKLEMPTYFPSAAQSEHALSDFSSKGPTQDGRIKPDLVAPGEYIESAASDNNLSSFQCHAAMAPPRAGAHPTAARKFNKRKALLAMEGTSMACPIATGTAALVRQYFLEGHYVDPVSRRPLRVDPSSALLKAVLISGTTSLTGTTVMSRGGARIPTEAAPSYHQGFGRLEMGESLSYDLEAPAHATGGGGSSPARAKSKYRLFVKDRVSIRTGQVHHYCFRIRSGSAAAAPPPADDAHQTPIDFKATLVWTDPPPVLPTSMFLVNNLDLMIVGHNLTDDAAAAAGAAAGTTHRVYLGNARLRPSTPAQLHFDQNNNVEKAVVASPQQGALYSVVVRGTHVPVSGASAGAQGQAYALAVNGDFDVEDAPCPAEVYCANDCSGHGQCIVSASAAPSGADDVFSRAPNTGMCRCEPHWAGSDCSIEAKPMIPNASAGAVSGTMTLQVVSDQWSYVYYDVRAGDRSLSWRMSRLTTAGGNGDPDFYFTSASTVDPLFTYPTLNYHNYSNTECDPCLSKYPQERRVHTQTMRAPDLFLPSDVDHKGGGTVMLGIWGYCCEGARVELELKVERG